MPNIRVDNFDPFALSWQRQGERVALVDHFKPDRKVDYWMHKPQRDWKPWNRRSTDEHRVSANRLVSYKHPEFARALYGAAVAGDPAMLADSALYAHNVINGIYS